MKRADVETHSLYRDTSGPDCRRHTGGGGGIKGALKIQSRSKATYIPKLRGAKGARLASESERGKRVESKTRRG